MIILNKELFEKIVKQCEKELPYEACGILAGPPSCIGQNEEDSVRRVSKVYEMANADKSSATFFMDPKEQLKVMKEIRNNGLEMLGIYHSHVASEAYPSSHDIELSFYPEVSYVIVSLRDRHNPSMRSFKIKDGKIAEEEVRIK